MSTTPTPETLGEALPNEIQRCQELLEIYNSLGPVGAFGHAMISADIASAQRAMMEGDVVAMIRCYQKLKEAE